MTTGHDVGHTRLADPEVISDRPLSLTVGITSAHRFGVDCQMRLVVDWVPPLAQRIKNVVSLCTEKQVCRVAAWRVVAAVKDAQPVRDLAMGQGPRHPMRQQVPPLVHQLPVAPAETAATSPLPTVAGSIKAGPEPLKEALMAFSGVHSESLVPYVIVG